MLKVSASKTNVYEENNLLKDRIEELEKRLDNQSRVIGFAERLGQVMEYSINEIYFFKKDTFQFVHVNKSGRDNLGYTMEELKSMTPFDIKPEFDQIKFSGFLAPLLIGAKEKIVFETIHKRKDGSFYNVEIHIQLQDFDDEQLFTAYILDITDRKKSEQTIKEIKERFKKLSTLTFEGIVIHNQGIVEDVNLSGLKMFGYKYDELIGKNIIEKLIPQKHHQTIFNKIKNKSVLPYECEGIKKDGTIFPIEIQARDVSLKSENRTVWVAAVRDISNRKNSETLLKKALEKANESDRIKSAFLTTMSHELRTPLNAIIGFSSLIDEEMSLDEILELTKIINESGRHLLDMIQDLFDITLIGTGEVSLNRIDFNLHYILENVYNEINKEIFKANKMDLEFKLITPENSASFVLNSDPHKIKKILMYLLQNAIKFTHSGHVHFGYTIRKLAGSENVVFYVKDTGIGIPEHMRSVIFEAFRQVEEAHDRKYEGLGIGLSIAKKIVELLGGKIWFESELGSGTTFYFTIKN